MKMGFHKILFLALLLVFPRILVAQQGVNVTHVNNTPVTATGIPVAQQGALPAGTNALGGTYPVASTNTDFSAVTFTAALTSTTFSISGQKQDDIFFSWTGITGAPATCTIQVQAAGATADTPTNSGTAIAITGFGVGAGNFNTSFTGTMGVSVRYLLSCGTFPTGGTVTQKTVYK